MKHARSDYNRIQDPEGLIGENEPVFIVRAKDRCAPATVRAWANHAELIGAAPDMVAAARRHADAMEAWQVAHPPQVPDAPASVL